jgi:hypothetical protein
MLCAKTIGYAINRRYAMNNNDLTKIALQPVFSGQIDCTKKRIKMLA